MPKMTCPICGKEYDNADADFLENGNPACHECVMKENEKNQEEEK